MTPEAQRIAIAEACGWRHSGKTLLGHPEEKRATAPGWIGPGSLYRNYLPDYLIDLNAMHGAEKVLTNVDVAAEYSRQLIAIYSVLHPSRPFIETFYWHATAAQRAEALLRTIGKWDDSK